MWHRIAPVLARTHRVIAADLRGYGRSSKPPTTVDHAPYSKRAMAADMAGKLRIAKVNVDENQSISQRHGVQGIPTMMVVKGGKIVDRWSGALPEAALRQKVSPWVN